MHLEMFYTFNPFTFSLQNLISYNYIYKKSVRRTCQKKIYSIHILYGTLLVEINVLMHQIKKRVDVTLVCQTNIIV